MIARTTDLISSMKIGLSCIVIFAYLKQTIKKSKFYTNTLGKTKNLFLILAALVRLAQHLKSTTWPGMDDFFTKCLKQAYLE